MTHKKIRIPRENADEIMRVLGTLEDCIEFEDLTKHDIDAKKNFGEMINRCDEMIKKINDFHRICYDFHLPFESYSIYEGFSEDIKKDLNKRDKKFGSTYFDLIENEILENDRKINELVDSHTQMREDLINLIEKKHVFLKSDELMRSGESGLRAGAGTNLYFISGVISAEFEMKMKRMIFRISRGRAITAFYSLEINNDEYLLTTTVRERERENSRQIDVVEEKMQRLSIMIQSKVEASINTKKKIFTIVFPGTEENILLERLLKVCEVFQASRYQIPKDSTAGNEANKITKEISDKKTVMATIEKNINEFCLSNNTLEGKVGYKYSLYKLYLEQEKMVYIALNKCIVRDTFIDGSVWTPTKEVGKVTSILQNIFKGDKVNKTSAYLEDIPFEENAKPPTFIKVNEFTSAFQNVVDIYGIPKYREINPGYFTIVTFPFLFGVMFGDIGHGFILFVFGIYLCLNNQKLERSKSLLKPLLFGRYFLLLMGFFALYCGFLYNDFLSIPIYFYSCYNETNTMDDNKTIERKIDGCNYKFGVDPIWYATDNELTFLNSLKMKLSVILGVVQMVLGIVLKGINDIFEKQPVEFIFVFLSQLFFMLILFGYMDFLIFVKWDTYYPIEDNATYNCSGNLTNSTLNFNQFAPDIKTYLMDIFLKGGKLPDRPSIPTITVGNEQCEAVEFEDGNYDWYLLAPREIMNKLHLAILILAILFIVTMFAPKVLFFLGKSKKGNLVNKPININNNNNLNKLDNEAAPFQGELIFPEKEEKEEKEAPTASNFIVECSIETIEYILGTVSNTASYLRLWALSLAHSRLANVFFDKIIVYIGGITDSWYINAIIIVVVFPIFAGCTAIVLLFMDVMECFLHTLRLHWVEFQNKFYKADGYQFKPFSFKQNIKLKDNEFNE